MECILKVVGGRGAFELWLDRAFGPFIYSLKEIGLLRFLVQQIFEILFSLWVQAYAGYTEGLPEGMWHCRGMCTFGISKILVKEGGGMVSAHSEGDLAPKKVPWRPCAKIMSFNETFVLHHGNFWIQPAMLMVWQPGYGNFFDTTILKL